MDDSALKKIIERWEESRLGVRAWETFHAGELTYFPPDEEFAEQGSMPTAIEGLPRYLQEDKGQRIPLHSTSLFLPGMVPYETEFGKMLNRPSHMIDFSQGNPPGSVRVVTADHENMATGMSAYDKLPMHATEDKELRDVMLDANAQFAPELAEVGGLDSYDKVLRLAASEGGLERGAAILDRLSEYHEYAKEHGLDGRDQPDHNEVLVAMSIEHIMGTFVPIWTQTEESAPAVEALTVLLASTLFLESQNEMFDEYFCQPMFIYDMNQPPGKGMLTLVATNAAEAIHMAEEASARLATLEKAGELRMPPHGEDELSTKEVFFDQLELLKKRLEKFDVEVHVPDKDSAIEEIIDREYETNVPHRREFVGAGASERHNVVWGGDIALEKPTVSAVDSTRAPVQPSGPGQPSQEQVI